MFNNLKLAFGRRLQRSTWLSEKTKKAALRKLIAMRLQMGGPEQTLSYERVDLAQGQFLRNVFKVREYRMRDFLDRIGESLNPDEWGVSAQCASAWYRPYRNVVLLPAGSINALLRPEVDDAYNYGVFGTRLGHEITHGFDQQGRLHDQNGQRKDWWSKSDVTAFRGKARKLADYYGAFTVLDGEHVDGERTLDENIADLGGLCIAFDAYLLSLGGVEPPIVDGFSGRQRFFLAYAQKWREVLSDFAMRFRLKGWHAPPRFRANGPVYHLSEFYEAFPEAGSGGLSLRRDERICVW
jgi:putative endopeptidase